MQSVTRSTLIAVAALGTGILTGWFLRGERPPAETAGRHGRSPLFDVRPLAQQQSSTQERAHAEAVTELERMNGMPVSEFAKNMADAWMGYGGEHSHLRKALYLSACDAERAMAFYLEYKQRKGLTLQDNAWLQEFFTIVGKRDGKGFMEQLLAASPKGVPEIDNVVHGWAVAKPQEAVDWLNAIPDGAPYYGIALKGLMWGLAESSPAMAVQVYESLDPVDRNRGNARNLILGTLENHGMKGIHDIVTSAGSEEDRRLFLVSGMESGAGAPPAEFVKWMAGPLESAPDLRGHFERMASRWAAAAPDQALDWLAQNGLSGGGSVGLSSMAASLVQSGKSREVEAWLAKHPDAPGHAAILAGTQNAGAAGR